MTLRSRGDGAAVSDGRVRVVAQRPGGREVRHAAASGAAYEALFRVGADDDWRAWRFDVAIAGGLGPAAFSFTPPRLPVGWAPDPVPLAGAGILLALFWQGFVRLRRRGRRDHAPAWRAGVFVAGVTLGVLALVSPVDGLGERYLLSAHMLQHVVLGDLAPALCLLALRGPLALFLLPAAVLGPLARAPRVRGFASSLARPGVAAAVWLVAYAGWHIPAAYDAALAHRVVHDLEHLSFVVAGTLVWLVLVDPLGHQERRSRRILVALLVLLGGTVLADVLIFSPVALYPAYEAEPERLFGLSPLEDQRLAGLVMIVEQILTVVTCLVVLLRGSIRVRAARAGEAVAG